MYADVIPFLRLPKKTTFFTYEIPSEIEGILSIGQFVSIPFRGKTVFGVVYAIHSNIPNFKRISSILSIVETQPSWTKAHLDTLMTSANNLYESPANLAKALSPSIPKKTHEIKSLESAIHLSIPEIDTSIAVAKPDLSKKHQTVIFRSLSEKILVLQQILKKTEQQTLIIAPQKQDAEELYLALKSIGIEAMLWEHTPKKNLQWALWQKMKEERIVIGTRSVLFAPLQELGQIIIDQSEISHHKSWEGSPFYDARILAKELGQRLTIPIISLSVSSKIDNTSPHIYSENPPAPIRAMHHESTELFHPQLSEQIQETIKLGKDVIVILQKKQQASTLYCLDCHHQWKCPNGHGNLTMKNNELACRFCLVKQALPTSCKSCGSLRVKSYGMGVDGYYGFLKRDGYHVHRLSANNWEFEQITSEPSILLMTPSLLKRYYFESPRKKPGMILLGHPEDLLFLPDYRSNETLFTSIQSHRSITKDYFDLPLTIQTRLEFEDPVWNYAFRSDVKSFKSSELKNRKRFKYPPFAQLIGITLTDVDEAQLEAIEAQIRDHELTYFGPTKIKRLRDNKIVTRFVLKQIDPETKPNLDKILDSAYSNSTIELNPEWYI